MSDRALCACRFETSRFPLRKSRLQRKTTLCGAFTPRFFCSAVYAGVYTVSHASCMRYTVHFRVYARSAAFAGTIYELFIEYSNRLYRICKRTKAVDNSGKSDVPYALLWITLWTVWKCMRLCTGFGRNEYTRMDFQKVRKVPNCLDIVRTCRETALCIRSARSKGPNARCILIFCQKRAILHA